MKGSTQLQLFAGSALAVNSSEWLHQIGAVEVRTRRDNLTNQDALAVLGAGLEAEYPSQRWLAEGRYDLGLTDVHRPSFGTSTVHNKDVRIRLGWVWPPER